jgi:His-Xaa-Ser system radical SAM maturase HxsC
MKPLTLSGRAVEIKSELPFEDDAVIRVLAGHGNKRPEAHDALLVKTPADLRGAENSGFATAVVVGDLAVAEGQFGAVVRLGPEFDYLDDGDVLGIDPHSRRVRVLYRRGSRHNFFLVTERCNHYCLMCSQPPKDVDDSWLLRRIEKALPLLAKETPSIGFTGGETLTDWRAVIQLLGVARDQLPDTAVHVLTNGRAFADPAVTRAWANLRHPNLTAGIPIYAAVDYVHDHVVQAENAFDETVLGILRLRDAGQRVEIRIVLHQLSIPYLVETARWIARNLPFVDHVALMGLENTGFAIANHDQLWIDPVDYRDTLADAVELLDASRLPVSIYNLPFCVLKKSVWRFARQSISDWKNAYLAQCEICAAKPQCAGFFSSGRPRNSRAIRPIEEFEAVGFGE